MKQAGFLSCILMAAFAGAVTAYGYDKIDYDSIAEYPGLGPATVPVLTIIGNINQLKSYCVATNYDTALLPELLDFTEKTVIGFLVMTGGGNRVDYRTIQHIVDRSDTIFIEFQPDSLVYPEDLLIAAAHKVLLLAIARTEKPIVIMESLITAAVNSFYHSPRIRYTRQAPVRIYNLQGRSITADGRNSTGLIISGEKQYRKRVISCLPGIEN